MILCDKIKHNEDKTLTTAPPKNLNYIRPVHSLEISDAFSVFANPEPNADRPITLIKPPVIFSKNSYSTPLTMPLGLTYVAAVLEKAGYRVKIIDCPGLDSGRIALTPDGRFKVQGLDLAKSLELIDSDTDIIGVSIMFSQEWPFIRKYIQRIRAAFPRTTLIVGGEHATAMPEYTLRDCPEIDFVVTGEGEMAFLELIHSLRTGGSGKNVTGAAYLEQGQFYQTGLTPRIAEIKNMPQPAWHLINVESYFQPNFTMGIGHGRNIAMLATRGCPYQCTFCSNPTMWTTRYVMRPVKDVVDEIENYVAKYQVNSIDFYDLTAIVKRDWILEFIAELAKRKINIVWQLPSGTRSESLDEEVIQGLAKTGCEFLVYAPESGSSRTLDMIKKRVNLANLTKSIVTALRYGIVVKVNFIIGFPFETREDIWRTLLFIWRLGWMKADDCNVSTFSPYPGSELFNELVKENAFGEINDSYFEGLMTQFDFTLPKTFCRHVSAFEILVYRILGMSVFYFLSYARKPSRLARLLKALFQKGPFQPRSLFEQRVYDYVARLGKTPVMAN